jgi:hypothetical protein
MTTPASKDNPEECNQAPLNRHEKIRLFVEGAAGGAIGGAIGALVMHKLGISFDAPIESVLITAPAVTAGLNDVHRRG